MITENRIPADVRSALDKFKMLGGFLLRDEVKILLEFGAKSSENADYVMQISKEEIEKMIKALEKSQAEEKARAEAEKRAFELKRKQEEELKAQMAIVEQIKQKVLKSRSMVIEEEQILEDKSVVLVVNM